jgi:hypothetical protein
MDRRRRYLYVLLVLCTLLSCYAATSQQNACGGSAPLTNQPMSWCDPGEHASSTPECRLGVFHCSGPNTVICMPIDCPESNRYQSSFVASQEIESPAPRGCPSHCGERGRCDQMAGECVCDKGWGGERCEVFEDACSSPLADCGANGLCVSKADGAYECRCAEGWTGASCNVPTQCLPNGLWIASSRKCSCFEGWEGPSCTACNPDFLCVPTENREQPFALTYVPKDMQERFLESDLGSKYAASRPIRPNTTYEGVRYDCACKAASSSSLAKSGGEELQENLIYYDDLTGAFYIRHDPYRRPYYSRYTHDYYWRYHYDPNTAAASLLILCVLFLVPFIWFGCLRAPPPPPPKIAATKKEQKQQKAKNKNYVHAVPSAIYEAPDQHVAEFDIEAGDNYTPPIFLQAKLGAPAHNFASTEGEGEEEFHLQQF